MRGRLVSRQTGLSRLPRILQTIPVAPFSSSLFNSSFPPAFLLLWYAAARLHICWPSVEAL